MSWLRSSSFIHPGSALSELLGDAACEWRFFAAGMFGGNRLNQSDPGLFRSRRIVPHPAGHNEELSCAHIDRPAVGFTPSDPQTSAQHKEKLVFTSMRVPWELALDTRYFYKLIVDLTHHSRRPQLGESLTREFQRNRKLLHREGGDRN
jgi:hypothetical protein